MKPIVKAVLALDLATSTGWAQRSRDGSIATGVKLFLPHTVPGERWMRFSAWLESWGNLDMVVYEEPIHHHMSGAAAEIAFAFSTRVQEFCARRDIPCRAVHNWDLKGWATGKRNASKELMLTFAKSEGWKIMQNDEIDARWLLEYTINKLLKFKGVI